MSQTDRDKWNAKYRDATELSAPSPFLLSVAGELPRSGRALDVAGGTGRHALWLARHGLEVTLADVSDVALESAARHASASALRLNTLQADLETDGLPPGPWDVVACFYFLHRPLFTSFASALAPGGWLVFAHPTRRNLERHPRPGPAHLLEDGELPSLVTGLQVVRYEEGWTESGRHEARLLATRRRL